MATFTPVRPVFASLPEFPDWGESLVFQLNGLVVVFVALGAIWGLMELTGWAFRVAERTTARRPARTAAAPLDVAPALADLPLETVAAISASAYLVSAGLHFRVTAITPAGRDLDWAREGRRAIFASHQTH